MGSRIMPVFVILVLIFTGCAGSAKPNELQSAIFDSAESAQLLYDYYLEATVDSGKDLQAVADLLLLEQWVSTDEPNPASPAWAYLKTDIGNVIQLYELPGRDYDLAEVYKEARVAQYEGYYHIPKAVLPALSDYMDREGFVTEPGMTGYVMNMENESILVVSAEAEDYSATGGDPQFYSAAWFSGAPRDIEPGDQVKVWYAYMLHSYPGQSELRHIEVMQGSRPEGAILTEAAALQRLLASGFFRNSRTHDDSALLANKVMAVQAIEFNRQQRSWSIQLFDTMAPEDAERVYHFRLDDREPNGR